MKNYPASVRAKLIDLSKEKKVDHTGLLIRYATDRLLYRISKSEFHSKFVLKGSLLFSVWNQDLHRPTKDADLLGFGDNGDKQILHDFQKICSIEIEEDGLTFDVNSLKIESIREEEEYDGKRVKLFAFLDGAKIPVQIDIGYGDVVTPEVIDVELPSLIELPATKLQAYPRETVVAEKTEALVKLGIANSRMKDFYDLKWLSDHYDFDGALLSKAIAATFERRRTNLPTDIPVGLSDEFFSDNNKQTQWNAFSRKLYSTPESFVNVGKRLKAFILPPLLESKFDQKWEPGTEWT